MKKECQDFPRVKDRGWFLHRSWGDRLVENSIVLLWLGEIEKVYQRVFHTKTAHNPLPSYCILLSQAGVRGHSQAGGGGGGALSFSPNPHQSPQASEGPLTSRAFHTSYHLATQRRDKRWSQVNTISMCLATWTWLTYLLPREKRAHFAVLWVDFLKYLLCARTPRSVEVTKPSLFMKQNERFLCALPPTGQWLTRTEIKQWVIFSIQNHTQPRPRSNRLHFPLFQVM